MMATGTIKGDMKKVFRRFLPLKWYRTNAREIKIPKKVAITEEIRATTKLTYIPLMKSL
jgi:hypothetical protein